MAQNIREFSIAHKLNRVILQLLQNECLYNSRIRRKHANVLDKVYSRMKPDANLELILDI
jgi:hypothetical protein